MPAFITRYAMLPTGFAAASAYYWIGDAYAISLTLQGMLVRPLSSPLSRFKRKIPRLHIHGELSPRHDYYILSCFI